MYTSQATLNTSPTSYLSVSLHYQKQTCSHTDPVLSGPYASSHTSPAILTAIPPVSYLLTMLTAHSHHQRRQSLRVSCLLPSPATRMYGYLSLSLRPCVTFYAAPVMHKNSSPAAHLLTVHTPQTTSYMSGTAHIATFLCSRHQTRIHTHRFSYEPHFFSSQCPNCIHKQRAGHPPAHKTHITNSIKHVRSFTSLRSFPKPTANLYTNSTLPPEIALFPHSAQAIHVSSSPATHLLTMYTPQITWHTSATPHLTTSSRRHHQTNALTHFRLCAH